MTQTFDRWEITRVLIDPTNAQMFTGMDETELGLLAASITEVGMIQPLTVRTDGRIIAGEQRYRAALLAGLATVPVIIRDDIGEEEVEKIRIHENLIRRGIRPSEQARAIGRLYELNGLMQGRHVTERNMKTRTSIADQLGWSERKVSALHTLANLIMPLAERWDKGEITRAVAFQIAQLTPEQQQPIADLFATADTIPNLSKEIADYKKAIQRLERSEPLSPSEREEQIGEELAQLRLEHKRALDELAAIKVREQQAEAAAAAEELAKNNQAVIEADRRYAFSRHLAAASKLYDLVPIYFVPVLEEGHLISYRYHREKAMEWFAAMDAAIEQGNTLRIVKGVGNA